MLKNKCCLYVIISIRFFSITICNLLIEFPSYTEDEFEIKLPPPFPLTPQIKFLISMVNSAPRPTLLAKLHLWKG